MKYGKGEILLDMESIFIIIKCTFFLCLLCGYFYVTAKLLKVEFFAIPIFVISTIATIVYLGGLLAQLLFVSSLLIGIGIVFFIILCRDIYKGDFKLQMPAVGIGITVGFFIFLIPIVHAHFIHYDNFSHWLLVVKELLITDAFPNANSVLIEFTNYPLGTASFIYFVCEIVGDDDWIMLMAQNLIIFACFLAIFSVIKERKRSLLTLFLTVGCSFFSYFNLTIRINNLLVDFLLPVLTLAIIAVIYAYRKNIDKMFILIIPMIGFLLILKNTGVIYALVACTYLLYIAILCKREYLIGYCPTRLQRTQKGKLICLFFYSKVLLVLLFSFSTTIFWKIHLHRTFSDVENKFSMDLTQLSQGFQQKTLNEIEEIVHLYLSTVLDESSRVTFGYFFINVIAILGWIIGTKLLKKKWRLLQVVVLANIFLVSYYIGILGMYIFQMPTEEAIVLAGFERYTSSIMIFFLGLIVICATVDIEHSFYYKIGEVEDYRSFRSIESKNCYMYGVISLLIILMLILTSEYNGILYNNNLYETTLPAKVKAVVGDSWSEEVSTDKYLLYASDTEQQVTSYYLEYIGKYYLRANNVDSICMFYEDNMLHLLSQYDYLVVVESDQLEQELMQKYFGVDGDSGIYKIGELNNMISQQ